MRASKIEENINCAAAGEVANRKVKKFLLEESKE